MGIVSATKEAAARLTDALASISERAGVVTLQVGPIVASIYPWQPQSPPTAPPPPKPCGTCGKP